MAQERMTRAYCLTLLKEKYRELRAEGNLRYPRRSDFPESAVVAIKAYFGPWPRALEAAGIKPPREDDRAERNREKRIRAKHRRIEALKQREREQKTDAQGET